MTEKVIIETDPSGKNLYEATNENCSFYQSHLDKINTWIVDLDRSDLIITLKSLYSLDALVTIASVDLSITSSELYLN